MLSRPITRPLPAQLRRSLCSVVSATIVAPQRTLLASAGEPPSHNAPAVTIAAIHQADGCRSSLGGSTATSSVACADTRCGLVRCLSHRVWDLSSRAPCGAGVRLILVE